MKTNSLILWRCLFIAFLFCSALFISDTAGAQVAFAEPVKTGIDSSFYNLTERELADFKDKAIRKTGDLGKYLSCIVGCKTSIERTKSIKNAIRLFLTDSILVEVNSNKMKNPRQFPVRQYLNRLASLSYVKANVTMYNVTFVSKFKKLPNGMYQGIATFFQRFEGQLKDNYTYADITRKDVEVYIKSYEDPIDKSLKWDVYLGNIKVSEN
jgi:hypothetical protein